MSSFTDPPQRTRLLKLVKKRFEIHGWSLENRETPTHDLVVSRGKMRFLIKCRDETSILYNSNGTLIQRIEADSSFLLRQLRRVLITILDRNFLSISLEDLLDRKVLAVEANELELITSLANFSNSIPKDLDSRQTFLLQTDPDYAIFVSSQYRAAGDYDRAITWARHAIANNVGFSWAHMHLFALLRDTSAFDLADDLAKIILSFRPDDPEVLRAMRGLAQKKGDIAAATEWDRRLKGDTVPRSLNEIIAKQRRDPMAPSPIPNLALDKSEPKPTRMLLRIWSNLYNKTLR